MNKKNQKSIKDQLECINNKVVISGDTYKHENKTVPRVTEVLSSMLHEEYIVKWANSLGFKRKGYMATLNEASVKGTYSHLAIEKYIQSETFPDYESLPYLCRDTVYNTFNSFLEWWKVLKEKHEVEIVFQEKKLICKWFGGTLDLLLKIDGQYWLIDFKTSNHLSYKYPLQLSAYRYALKELHDINVAGCIILQLNKTEIKFMEQVMDLSIESTLSYMDDCEETFLSLVYAYYRRIDIENQYKERYNKYGEYIR